MWDLHRYDGPFPRHYWNVIRKTLDEFRINYRGIARRVSSLNYFGSHLLIRDCIQLSASTSLCGFGLLSTEIFLVSYQNQCCIIQYPRHSHARHKPPIRE